MYADTTIHCPAANINSQSSLPVPSTGAVAETNETNVLTVPVPVSAPQQTAVARAEAVLPLAAASSTTNFETLPVALVLNILWPYLGDLPTMAAIEREFHFSGALRAWLGPIGAQVVQDLDQFRIAQRNHRSQEAWAVSFGVNGSRHDYLYTGLAAYPGNRFWASHFNLPGIGGDDVDPRAAVAHRIDSLRISLELMMHALFEEAPLADHRYLLAAVDELYAGGKGFSNVQLAQEKARNVGLASVLNVTLPSYSPIALNNMRMSILMKAVDIVAMQANRR